MDPADLSARLRSVSDRVDASRRPSLVAVTAELRSVLSDVVGGTVVQNTCPKCGERHVGKECPTCGTLSGPEKVSSSLRSISERILSSERPSRSAVTAELRRVLAAMDQVSVGPTKVVVSESWTLEEVKALAPAVGGTDIRTGPYGDVGLVVPADKVDAVQEGGGEFHVFDTWEEASGDDPEFAFEPVAGPAVQTDSWRKTVLDAVLDEGEVSADSLHEGADGQEEVDDALAAADALVAEGLLSEQNGVYVIAPGKEAAVKEAARLST